MATSLKAQEVLDSLIGVLQGQADQLPAIHARLGLPHEALEDDLDHLRKQLEVTITTLVDRRRVEVNEWERRCHAVERDCSALGKCLGGNLALDEAFVTQLHDEPILPTRHAMILKHQAELQKIYTTRLDQRNALARMLVAQERVLGSDFHSAKHTQLYPTTTEYDKDGQVVRRSVTTEKLAELEAQIERGRAEIRARLVELCTVLADFLQLHVDLGLDLPSETDPLADTSLVITEDETQVFPCASPSKPGGGRPKYQPGTPDYYDSIFAQYVANVTLANDPDLTTCELKNVEPTKDVFDYFRQRFAEIEPERQRREARVQVIFDELEMLWARLSMPDNYADEFALAHTGVSDATLQAYEQELYDMQEKRREHLPLYTESAREQIVKMWDGLMAGPNERARFPEIHEEHFSEDLLIAHEQQVVNLRNEWKTKEPVLELVHRYMRVMQDEDTLLELSKDPARLTGKGGILLKEEKLRKRLNRDKPKVVAELRPAILAWEQANGTDFIVNDTRFLDYLTALKPEPEPKARAKPAIPPRGTTPGPSTGQKHSAAPHSAAPSAKRAKLGVSTTSSQRGVTPTPASRVPPARGTTPSASRGTTGRHPLHSSAAHNNKALPPPPIPGSKFPPSLVTSTPAAASSLPRPTTAPRTGFGYGQASTIGLGPPPKSPTRQASNGSVSSTSTVRLVSGSSSASTLRSYSASSFRTSTGEDVASLVLAKGRRGSFRPRPSMNADLPLPLQNMAEQSRSWTTVKEESDEDDDFDEPS